MHPRTSHVLLAALIPLTAMPASGQIFNENTKMVTNDIGQSNRYGGSVALDNGTIVFSTLTYWSNKADTSAAYLFDLKTNTQILQLIPEVPLADSWFGLSTALDNNIVAIGAPQAETTGAAFLFDRTTGTQLAKLIPNETGIEESFGWSIAIDNGIVAIGALLTPLDGRRAGAVYLFDIQTGTLLHKLQPDEGIHNLSFGSSIAINSGTVVIGAPNDFDAGSVYLFNALTGKKTAQLFPEGDPPFARFGVSVDINDGIIAVGAPVESNIGSVYLFDANTKSQLHELRPIAAGLVEHVGTSVCIDNGLVAISALNYSDTVSSGLDIAYIYDISTGELVSTLAPSDHGLEDSFGRSIAMENGTVVVSSTDVNEFEEQINGSIYTFDLNAPTCIADFNDDGEINFFDFSVFIYAFGRHEQLADLTYDGLWNFYDISAFLLAYSAGCP